MAGINTPPTLTVSARAVPEMPANNMEATTLAMERPPVMWPTILLQKPISRSVMPPWFIRFPARMKKGMAVNVNLLIPTKVRWAAVRTDTSRGITGRMAAREEIPMA